MQYPWPLHPLSIRTNFEPNINMQYSAPVILTALLKTVASSIFTNPLKPKDRADPFIIYVEGNSYAEGYYYLSFRATTLEGL